MNKIKLSIKEFTELAMVTDKTIRAFIKKRKNNLITHYLITQEGNRKKYYLDRSLLEGFIHPYFFKVEKLYVSLLKRSKIENYADFLAEKDWDVFGCVNYDNRMNNFRCREIMQELFEYLTRVYVGNEVRLFFANEVNPSRLGYHTHFVAYVGNEDRWTEVKRHIHGFLRIKTDCIADIEEFNPELGGLRYITKEINVNPDGFDYLDTIFHDTDGDFLEQKDALNDAA
jgi:succinate dehydrogenase flavin-adding protein (antitoxin of CptAB toxin-antitoxin module)